MTRSIIANKKTQIKQIIRNPRKYGRLYIMLSNLPFIKPYTKIPRSNMKFLSKTFLDTLILIHFNCLRILYKRLTRFVFNLFFTFTLPSILVTFLHLYHIILA